MAHDAPPAVPAPHPPSQSLLDYMHQFVATELERIDARYLATNKGYRSAAGLFTRVLQPLLGTAAVRSSLSKFRFKSSFRISPFLEFTDSSRLDGSEALVDIKSLRIGESSSDNAFFRTEQLQLKPIDCRAVKVHKDHCKATKNLDSKYRHTPDHEDVQV